MTRPEPKSEEIVTGLALRNHLKQIDPNFKDIARDLKDRPDLAFIFNGNRVGCECVQIPPHRIFKFVHTRFKKIKGNGAVQIVWPQEPHIWAEDAIVNKTKMVDEFRENVNADEVWLLLHSPINEKDRTLRYENKIIVELIKYSAVHTKHNFNSIYFWDPKNGIQKIFPVDKVLTSLDFNFDGGYPADGFLIGTTPFTTTKEGEAPYEVDFGIIEPAVIIVPPMDTNFQKHKPRFKLKRYRVSAVVGANSADFKYEPIE